MSERQMLLTFDREETLVAAVRDLRQSGFAIADIHTPYAIHGLEQAAGFGPSRLGWVCAIGGFLAAGSMLLFQSWTSAVDWAINVGGKPFNSIPAFIPATFEVGVLAGGLGTVLAFLIRSRLYPGKEPELPDEGVTDDRFVVIVDENDASFDRAVLETVALRHAAVRVGERLAGRRRG